MQVATIENQISKALRSEGLTEFEVVAIMEDADIDWGSPVMASGFYEATYPVMLDTAGVFYMYSATTYDAFLIDKKGRLVTKVPFSDAVIFELNTRIRKLHAE